MEPTERVKRRLAAIWSADIAGYSRLMGADDAGTFAEMRTRRELLRAEVSGGGGRVVDAVGDNLLAEFSSAVDAVRTAIRAQETLAKRDGSLPESRRLAFRIGIHLGEVLVDGEAIAGDGVNVAARLCALAEPGGVCLSAAIAEQLRGKLELALEDAGEHQLKNIAAPVRIWRVHAAGVTRARVTPAAASAPPRKSRPAIAVLPFGNLTGDPAQEYLSDGIAEDLLTRMATWDLPVIARQSSFAYRGSSKDAREIGRELGAGYLVEGSLRRAGDRIRLAVQLIDAQTGEHVFAQNFDRELGDVFALQDEVTRAIAGSLGASVSRREELRALALAPENVGAWDAIMRANWHHNRLNPRDSAEASRWARRAVELDPRFARGHAVLSIIDYTAADMGWAEDPDESLARALRSAGTAIELDPSEFAAHIALGLANYRTRDLVAARRAFERAIELQPEVPSAHGNFGWFLAATGHFEEAVARLQHAIELARQQMGARGANHPLWHAHLGAALTGLGRYEEALRWLDRGLQIGSHSLLHGLHAVVLVRLGRLEEARREVAERLPGVTLTLVRRLMQQIDQRLVDRVIDALRTAGMPE
jgi:TolB-like protein